MAEVKKYNASFYIIVALIMVLLMVMTVECYERWVTYTFRVKIKSLIGINAKANLDEYEIPDHRYSRHWVLKPRSGRWSGLDF